jgi:hypothetical protein
MGRLQRERRNPGKTIAIEKRSAKALPPRRVGPLMGMQRSLRARERRRKMLGLFALLVRPLSSFAFLFFLINHPKFNG